jgi:hypothetical protein
VADLSVTWRGLTLGGPGNGPYHVEEITGWDDWPETTNLGQARTRGHGDFPGEQYARARIVTVSGTISSRQARDHLAQLLLDDTPVTSDVEDLAIETFGRPLTAGAQLVRRSLPVALDYASGSVPFALQWRCPDPLRYGPEKRASTGLPTPGTGLQFPLFAGGGLDFGSLGASGQMTLTNDGSADAGVVFGVVFGETHPGFELSAAGQRITYSAPVPARQTITVDTDAGTVVAEGTADRGSELTAADWLTVPRRGSLTVQFTSLGGIVDTVALATARWKDAHW